MGKQDQNEMEFENRVKEILAINPQDISSENLKNFIGKITNLVELVETNKKLKSKVDYIYKDSRVKSEENLLIEKGNVILKKANEILEEIESIIIESSVKFKTSDEVYSSHINQGVYTMSPDEAVAVELDNLRGKLAKDRKVSITEIKDVVSAANRVKWEFDTLKLPSPSEEKYKNLNDLAVDYEETMEKYDRLRRYTGQTDYEKLKGIWEWETIKNLTMGGVDYRLSPIYDAIGGNHLNYTSQRVSKEIEKYQTITISFQNRYIESIVKMDNRWWVKILYFIPRLIGKVAGLVWSKITF